MNEITKREWNEMKSIMLDIRAGQSELISRLTDEAGKELLTPAEICRILKVGRTTYQRYVKAGVINQIHVGEGKSRVYVKRSEIEELIETGKI